MKSLSAPNVTGLHSYWATENDKRLQNSYSKNKTVLHFYPDEGKPRFKKTCDEEKPRHGTQV